MIPEPNHSIALLLKHLRSLLIGFRMISMSASIKFDNQFLFQATEVHDVSADLVLPTELRTMQLAVTESPPECLLSVGLIPTETTCTVLEPSF